LSLCSQIIVHGRHIAEALIRCFGIDEHKLNIIPHGNYDIHLQAENARPSADPRSGQVLLFGRMKKYKGLNILIQAAPIVAEQVPDLKIILAGKGEELDRFEPKLRGNPLFDIRNRYISAKEAAGLFASSSLVVIPYIEASQSGPLHLAYSWGRPVVATRVGAIPESIKHGREGLLVPPNNPEALAEAMIEILRNPTLASNLGHQGRIKADTALKWEGNISEMTRAVYQKALRTSSKDVCVGDTSHLNRLKRLKEYYRTLGHD
jgi:glycosyltransferase involved in cell wall biosynthesis